MEPYHRKLGADTWYYAKRCFLGLALTLAKHMTTIRDSTMDDILEFLDSADQHGKDILTTTGHDLMGNNMPQHTISYEVWNPCDDGVSGSIEVVDILVVSRRGC